MAIENETDFLIYKNDEKYLTKENIAALLQNMLNTAAGSGMFRIFSDSQTEPAPNEPYVCTLKTRVEPFSLRGADCETVNVRLFIKIPVETASVKNKAVAAINKTLGPMSGSFGITENGETVEYSFFSNFKLSEMSDPELINSFFVGTFTLEGNMHITRAGGGVLSDVIKTYISIPETIDGVIDAGDYEVVCKTAQNSASSLIDTPVKAGSFQPDAEYNAITFSSAVNILYRNDFICNLLRNYIYGRIPDVENPFIDTESGKPVLYLKQKYPDSELVQPYFISDVTENREAGVYVVFTLSLIKARETEIVLKFKLSSDGESYSVTGFSFFKGIGEKPDLTVPATYKNLPVTEIGVNALKGCKSLKTCKISDGIIYINSYAFTECFALKNVSVPASVTYIGSHAFFYCSALESITIPANVTYIGREAFSQCDSLQSVVFENPDGWTTDGFPMDSNLLLNPQYAAQILKTTYSNFIWARTENT